MSNEELLDAFETACEQIALSRIPRDPLAQKYAKLREEILRRMEVGKG
jgi:hypothetical protein